MHLPEDTPGSFALFIDYLYRGTTPIGNSTSRLHDLYDLYFQAEKLCLIVLKDRVMDAIQDMSMKYDLFSALVQPDIIRLVYEKTGEEMFARGLRLFTIEMMIFDFFKKSKSRRDPMDRSKAVICLEVDEVTAVQELGKDHPSIARNFFYDLI